MIVVIALSVIGILIAFIGLIFIIEAVRSSYVPLKVLDFIIAFALYILAIGLLLMISGVIK